MSLMAVGTSRHGDSLPAELRVSDRFRNSPHFGLSRLGIGLLGLTAARGMGGLGDMVCDDSGNCFDDGSTTPIQPIDTTPVPISVSPTTVGPLAPGETYGPPPGGFVCPQDASGNCTAPATSVSSIPGYSSTIPGYSGPTTLPANATPPAAPAGYQWATLANQAGQTLAKVLAISQGGSSITLPNGTTMTYGSAASAANSSLLTSTGLTATLGSMAPLLLIAGGLFLVLSLSKK